MPLEKVMGQNFGGGLALGMNFAQIDGDNESGYRKPGAAIGGFVTYQLTDKLQLQPEILFDQVGSVSKNGFFSNRFNYFSIPVLVNFQIPFIINEEKRMLKFQAGPAPCVLLQAKDKLIAPPNDLITESYKAVDIRATLGLALDLNHKVSFNFRWAYSLAPFAKGTSNRFPLGGPWHKVLQLSFRYTLINNS
jgi:hypothetical protein